MKKINYIILFYLLLFVYLFFFTLNCNYAEGDDAATILYHLCGRDPNIQIPYAAYNSGFDYLIANSGLHTEPGMRVFAITVSFISGFLVLALLAKFLEEMFGDSKLITEKSRIFFYLLLPFILPDILFHSLIVNAAYTSFVFILISLLLFIKFLRNKKNGFLFFSMVIFALAIPFRWTMLIILPMYLGLALYFHFPQQFSKKSMLFFFKIMMANLAGVFLSIVFIYITGYNFKGIMNAIQSATGYLQTSEKTIVSMVASASAFLTPALLMLLFFGVFRVYQLNGMHKKYYLSILTLMILAFSPCILTGFFPSFKFLITLIPAMLVLMILGFDLLLKKKGLFALFLMVTIAPWFIGIQLDADGTFCGPGFELNTGKPALNQHFQSNPDKRIVIEKVNPKFDSGFYLPMSEGPRPLYGYFYVLFDGGWKKQINLFTEERQKNFNIIKAVPGAIYFQDRNTASFQCDLFRNGLSAKTGFITKEGYSYRKFTGNNINFVVNVVPDGVSKTEWIKKFMKTQKATVLFNSSYSNEILKLRQELQDTIKVLGPFSIIKK